MARRAPAATSASSVPLGETPPEFCAARTGRPSVLGWSICTPSNLIRGVTY